MKDLIINILRAHKKARILLMEIEKALPAYAEYCKYAEAIDELIFEGILVPLKSSEYNLREISLPLKYNINKSVLEKK